MFRVMLVGFAGLLATSAQAADQIVPEQTGYNWSGFYVGAGIGAALASTSPGVGTWVAIAGGLVLLAVWRLYDALAHRAPAAMHAPDQTPQVDASAPTTALTDPLERARVCPQCGVQNLTQALFCIASGASGSVLETTCNPSCDRLPSTTTRPPRRRTSRPRSSLTARLCSAGICRRTTRMSVARLMWSTTTSTAPPILPTSPPSLRWMQSLPSAPARPSTTTQRRRSAPRSGVRAWAAAGRWTARRLPGRARRRPVRAG